MLDAWEDGLSEAVALIHEKTEPAMEQIGEWELVALAAAVEAGRVRQAESLQKSLQQRFGPNRTRLTDWLRIQASRQTSLQNWKAAQWYFARLLDQNPNEWQLWRDRGDMFAEAGEKDRAEADRQQALSLEPDDQFRLFMAKQRIKQARWKEARDLFLGIHDLGCSRSLTWMAWLPQPCCHRTSLFSERLASSHWTVVQRVRSDLAKRTRSCSFAVTVRWRKKTISGLWP